MCEVHKPVCDKPPGLRGWLERPLYVQNLLFTGFAACLAFLAFAPLPNISLSVAFFAAVCLGIGTVSGLVFSPDANGAGSILAAFFLAFVMHGIVAVASLHAGYYPRMLAGSYLGEAIRISAWIVILEWGAIMVLGRVFASERRPAVPTLWVAGTLLFFVVAITVSLIVV